MVQDSAALIDGPHAFFGYTSGLDVVDISDPRSPSLADRIALPGGVRGLARAGGGGAWAAAGAGGVARVRPPGDEITLGAEGRRVRGIHTVDLFWGGAGSSEIDIYRDGRLVAKAPNEGAHTDSVGARGRATYVYRVCEAGTSACSNQVTVRFGRLAR